MCDLFFNKSLRGAWACGRYSADEGLKGIKKILVKLSSPEVLIQRSAKIIQEYYQPCRFEIKRNTEFSIITRISDFPEMDEYIEYRIGGWMERALQICGSKHVSIQIVSSLAKGAPYTEYKISWKKY